MALNKQDIEIMKRVFKESFKESIKPLEQKIEKIEKRLDILEDRVFNLELEYLAVDIKNVDDIKKEAMVSIGIKKGLFDRQKLVENSREIKQNPELENKLENLSADGMILSGIKAGQWTKEEIEETAKKIARYLNMEIEF